MMNREEPIISKLWIVSNNDSPLRVDRLGMLGVMDGTRRRCAAISNEYCVRVLGSKNKFVIMGKLG